MREQKSAGIVLFRNASNKNEFLLLNYPQGHWDFIKGKVEFKKSRLDRTFVSVKPN